MAVFKCKMCGGTIEFEAGATVGVCDSCGTKQTLPRLDDDKKANLYDRANHFRRNNDFDKAMSIYEQILNEDGSDAEAYWSLVLCRYGIEYVEDPATHKRVPTVNRTQFTSIYMDEDYKSALRYADDAQKAVYEAEARAIDDIQKGILEISAKESPFDVFICYKETDENGRRTPDSVLANDLYHQLVQEGFKVFFARITLEDKLGQEYEPYIFAALHSAKVMVVLGTKPEYFNAAWVRNEWSRYLALIRAGEKKMLIPAYKDMDPYDLPDEFSHLQAQDMSKLGFMQDLIRGIKKIVGAGAAKSAAAVDTAPANFGAVNTAPLLRRAFMFLEDGNWQEANEYCEKVLDQAPENAQAYLGKLLAELHVSKQEDLADCAEPFDDSNNYQKILRFGDAKLTAAVKGYITHINERNENARMTSIYENGVKTMEAAKAEYGYKAAANLFSRVPGFRDADTLAVQCREQAEVCRKDEIYARAEHSSEYRRFEEAAELFGSIPGWKDADARAEACEKDAIYEKALSTASWSGNRANAIEMLEQIRGWKDADEQIEKFKREIEKDEADRIATEKHEQSVKRIQIIALLVVAVIAAAALLWTFVLLPKMNYSKAISLAEAGNYAEAIAAFEALGNYKDSQEQTKSANYNQALSLAEAGNYAEAVDLFESLGDYKDSKILYAKYALFGSNIGDTVMFGTYEQDGDTENGKEEIEWLILDRQENRVLLLSKLALDRQPYNKSGESATWESCSLRQWLNETFYDVVFSNSEKMLVAASLITADQNSEYNTNQGNDTTDKVFLLSLDEIELYFPSDKNRICIPSSEASWSGHDEPSCAWWSRTLGINSGCAAGVNLSGEIDFNGYGFKLSVLAVRPAIWIELPQS